jgi:hypothetical protein
MNCANDSASDALVYQTIATATDKSHEMMKGWLKKILKIEAWDQTIFTMPEAGRKKPARAL